MESLDATLLPAFIEHRVPRLGGALYVRDFPGKAPAYVLLHGFPDEGRIYDRIIPRLVAEGRRVVTIDFLGFGRSDKPADAVYSFPQQVGDVEAVVETLKLDRIVAVGHDAGGPAAINFALKHPAQTAGVVLLNVFYGASPGLRVPELIELFSTKTLSALQCHFLTSPAEFGWLLNFQRDLLQEGLNADQKAIYQSFLAPLIDENFRQQPSAAPAFAQMTSQLQDEVAANEARLVSLRRSDAPFLLIWGGLDPYLHPGVGEHLRSQVKNGILHVLAAGHWPQIDAANDVARLMLAHA
jgi:pimeloyl-ACP methyl ester carboxylesterase